MNIPSLKWIYSGGGPYILATKSSALAWLGVQGLSAGEVSRYESDYLRACEGKDYVSVIAGDAHEILVITEPDEISYLSRAPGGDSDEQLWEALQFLDFESFEILPVNFTVSEPEMLLFDSAWQLADIGENCLEIPLELGCYSLSVLIYRPNDHLWLDIIRLKKIANLNQ
jgi:hypothetical protein